MKKSLLLCVLFLVTALAVLPGESADGVLALKEAYMSTGLNKDGSPKARVPAYVPSTRMLAAIAECTNVTDRTKITFLWYYLESPSKRIKFAEKTVKSPIQAAFMTFSSTVEIEKPWPEGNYAVDVYVAGNKKPLTTILFPIRKEVKNKPAPGKKVEKKPSPQSSPEGVFWTPKDAAAEKQNREKLEKTAVEKEALFWKNPEDFTAALEFASACAALNDAASLALAKALYEGLAETSPSDTVLAGLADCYARLFLYEKAFTAALRRTWNPLVPPTGAVSQIVFFAGVAGDWDRGIDYLERILADREDEREDTLLALASLYAEKARAAQDPAVQKECRKTADEILDRVIDSLPSFSPAAQNALVLKKELERR